MHNLGYSRLVHPIYIIDCKSVFFIFSLLFSYTSRVFLFQTIKTILNSFITFSLTFIYCFVFFFYYFLLLILCVVFHFHKQINSILHFYFLFVLYSISIISKCILSLPFYPLHEYIFHMECAITR